MILDDHEIRIWLKTKYNQDLIISQGIYYGKLCGRCNARSGRQLHRYGTKAEISELITSGRIITNPGPMVKL